MIEETNDASKARAICGAYLAVAFADADYAAVEEGRLMSTLINHPDLGVIDAESFTTCYNECVDGFRADYAGTLDSVLTAIRAERNNSELSKAIIIAAQLAIVADQKVLLQEEAILEKITAALGRSKGEI